MVCLTEWGDNDDGERAAVSVCCAVCS